MLSNPSQTIMNNQLLLREVVENFEPFKKARDRQTLLHLALSSKALSNLALDRLWKETDNVVQLLRILPGFKSDGDQLVSNIAVLIELEN